VNTYLQFIVLGFVGGSVYAVLGMSVVSVYTSTGIINFAQGTLAMWPAYVYAQLRSSGELVLPIGDIQLGSSVAVGPALAIALVCGVLLVLIAHVLVFRPLRKAPTLAQVVASVGLMLTLESLVVLRFGSLTVNMNPILPAGSVRLFGADLSDTGLILGGITVLAGALLWAYFRFTTYGIAARGAAQDERAARLLGFSPDRLAAVVWAITGIVCGVVVTLASPPIGLNPTTYTFFIVPALAVALVGRLSSIWITCAAGLVLGSFQSVISLVSTKTWWPSWALVGLQDAVPFVIVIVVMYLLGGRIPARGSLGGPGLPAVVIPRIRALPLGGLTALAVVLIFATTGNWRFGVIMSMVLYLLSLSLVVLTGYLGQISLAQMAFAGAAGFALSKFTYAYGWTIPFPLSIIAAALVATLFGVVLGIPALRIRGAQLAVVTLAAAVAIVSFVFNNPSLTLLGGNFIGSPTLFGLNLSVRDASNPVRVQFGLMVLAVVLIVTLLLVRILRGSTGRAMLAVRSNERAAASAGINVAKVKLVGFALSAFIAGVGGTLIGYGQGQLSSDSFAALTGISLLAVTYLGGVTTFGGAMIGGALGPLGVGYVFLEQTLHAGNYYDLISGLALIVTAIQNPLGIAGALTIQTQKLRNRVRRTPADRSVGAADQTLAGPGVDTEASAHVS
jgi:branched-chain amino acid transport system permease protein